MPQPMSTPTAAGITAPLVGITEPTVAPMPTWASGMRATWPSTIGRRAVFSAWRMVPGSMSLAQEMSLSLMLVGMSPPPCCRWLVVWPAGVEPASRAWRARILAVGRRPRGLRSMPGRTLTPVPSAGRSSATGRWLPEEDSNPHSRVTPTSFRLDDLASSTATGSRTPASGLRARRRAVGLPRRGRPSSGVRHDSTRHDARPYRGRALDSLSYGEHRLAGTTRTCDPRLRRAVLSSTELRRAGVDGRGRTCTSGFVDRCLLHSATSTWRHRRDLNP